MQSESINLQNSFPSNEVKLNNGNSINPVLASDSLPHQNQQEQLPYSSQSLTSEEKSKILSKFRGFLQSIDITQETIVRISSYALRKILKYPDAISLELFKLIEEEVFLNPRIEYLYLVNDIIQKIFLNKEFEQIKPFLLDSFFSFIKEICLFLYSTMIDETQKTVKYILGIWGELKIFKKEWLELFEFEIKMGNEPEFSGSNTEIEYLQDLVNVGSFKIDQTLIDYSKEFEELGRTNDNKYRKNILKMDKDLINKQLRLYHNQVQNLRDINVLLGKIKEYEDNTKNKEKEKQLIMEIEQDMGGN